MYHFGHTSPAENLTLYNLIISKLAAAVDLRCKANRKACVGGVIVNACGLDPSPLSQNHVFHLRRVRTCLSDWQLGVPIVAIDQAHVLTNLA